MAFYFGINRKEKKTIKKNQIMEIAHKNTP